MANIEGYEIGGGLGKKKSVPKYVYDRMAPNVQRNYVPLPVQNTSPKPPVPKATKAPIQNVTPPTYNTPTYKAPAAPKSQIIPTTTSLTPDAPVKTGATIIPTTTDTGGVTELAPALVDAPVDVPVDVPADTGPTIAEMMAQLQTAQRESAYAALGKARDNALSNLDTEAAGIAPQYYDKRNQVAASSDVGALNFAQYMAGRGIKGAAGGMPAIYRNSALQGNIGALNQQEQGANDAIARSRTGINNAYESDYAAAGADISAQGLQSYINQMNADRAFGLQESGVTGVYGGTPTMDARNIQFNQGISKAGLTGTYNGTPTLQNQQFQADETYRNKSFDETVRQFEATYGLDLREMDMAEAQTKIDNAFKQGQINQQGAQQALANAKFVYQKKQDADALIYNAEQDDLNRQGAAQEESQANYSNNLSEGNKMVTATEWDSDTHEYRNKYTPEEVQSWIARLGLDEKETVRLAKDLGVYGG